MNPHYDVLVIGGGFAGTAAAIAAARLGKRVRLIEQYNCLGGAASYDLVMPFMPYSTRDPQSGEELVLSRGLFGEILCRLRELGGMRKEPWGKDTYFDNEILKLVLNRMALEAGVELLFQTRLTEAERVGNAIRAVTVSNVSGLQRLTADFYIDATGDANLTAAAGFPFRLGRESDGLCQPMTLCFRVGNVDPDLYEACRGEINPLYQRLHREGRFRNPRENVLYFHTLRDNILHFNTTRVTGFDPTNAEDITRAEIEAREQVFELVSFLRENFEAFRHCQLLSTGMQIGVRESRRILGAYTLTQEDLLALTKFEDGIAACNYDIDIHDPAGGGTSHHYFAPGTYYTVPYRALIPQDSENLLVAGRCISATHEAQASLRIMPVCCNLGEAAGIAAALACESGCSVGRIDVSRLRARLRQNGAFIE